MTKNVIKDFAANFVIEIKIVIAEFAIHAVVFVSKNPHPHAVCLAKYPTLLVKQRRPDVKEMMTATLVSFAMTMANASTDLVAVTAAAQVVKNVVAVNVFQYAVADPLVAPDTFATNIGVTNGVEEMVTVVHRGSFVIAQLVGVYYVMIAQTLIVIGNPFCNLIRKRSASNAS